jgi:hypothetical protein
MANIFHRKTVFNEKKTNADFKKEKIKLGQKRKSTTETNLSFKSRAISMPVQSIAEDKSGKLVNQRNLSLEDLLTQLKHYNATVRKDAVLGLRDLLAEYPQLIALNLSAIAQAVVPLILDDERNVRRSLVTWLTSLLPQMNKNSLAPFMPLFMVYITSAMTHLEGPVRHDSLFVLNTLIQYFPDLVAEHYNELLPDYIALLSQYEPVKGHANFNTTDMKSKAFNKERLQEMQRSNENRSNKTVKTNLNDKTNAFKTRILVIQSFYAFLGALFGKTKMVHDTTEDLGIMKEQEQKWKENNNLFHTKATMPVSYDFGALFEKKSNNTQEESSVTIFSQIKTTNSDRLKRVSTSASVIDTNFFSVNTLRGLQNLFAAALPLLFEVWLECEPSDLSAGNIINLKIILNTVRLLLHNLEILELQHRINTIDKETLEYPSLAAFLKDKYLKSIQKYILAHFPFAVKATYSEKDRSNLMALNVEVCVVLTYFLEIKDEHSIEPEENRKDNKANNKTEVNWVEKITDFVITNFEGGEAKGRMPFAHYVMLVELLPVVKKLMLYYSQENTHDTEYLKMLFDAFNAYFKSSPAKSTSKKACIKFISDIIMNNSNMGGAMNSLISLDQTIVRDWLLDLPKTLWQLQTKSSHASQLILKLLWNFGCQSPSTGASLFNPDTLQNPMVPFFFTVVNNPKGAFDLFGPFVHLPVVVQKTAVELLYYFSIINPNMQRALMYCCQHPATSPDTVQYLLSVLKYPQHFASEETYVQFLLNLFTLKEIEEKEEPVNKKKNNTKPSADAMEIENEEEKSAEIGTEDKPKIDYNTRMLFLAKLLSYNLASLNSNIALSSVAALLKKTLETSQAKQYKYALHFLGHFAQRSLYKESDYNQEFVVTASQLALRYLLHCKEMHIDLDYDTVLFSGHSLKAIIINLFVLLINEWKKSQGNDAKIEFMKTACIELIQKMSVVESRDLLTSCKKQLNEVLGLMATTDKNQARKLEIELELLIGKLH